VIWQFHICKVVKYSLKWKMKYGTCADLQNQSSFSLFRSLTIWRVRLSHSEIFFDILFKAKLNLLGSIESNPLAHTLRVKHNISTTTRLRMVCPCHISMEHWHGSRNVVSVMWHASVLFTLHNVILMSRPHDEDYVGRGKWLWKKKTQPNL